MTLLVGVEVATELEDQILKERVVGLISQFHQTVLLPVVEHDQLPVGLFGIFRGTPEQDLRLTARERIPEIEEIDDCPY